MENPNVSVIEKRKESIPQEEIMDIHHPLFANEDEALPDNDPGESPDIGAVLSTNIGIVICSAPKTQNSNDNTTSQNEEFKTLLEESRLSVSCKEPPLFPLSGGDPKPDSSDSGAVTQGDELAAADSASAYLKIDSSPGTMNENLGFTKTRISEMMEILSDGKTRGRDVPNVELKQFYARKRDADSKDINPSPKTMKASAEKELATVSPIERIEVEKATIKAETVNPSSHDVAEKFQSTEPVETVKVEDNIDEVAVFCDKDEEHFTKEQLDLAQETAERGYCKGKR